MNEEIKHLDNSFIPVFVKKTELKKILMNDDDIIDKPKKELLFELAWQERHESGCEAVASFMLEWLELAK